MNTPIDNHEDNADEIMELLKILGIEKAMVGGYSTGEDEFPCSRYNFDHQLRLKLDSYSFT